jgi:hypothetical protein
VHERPRIFSSITKRNKYFLFDRKEERKKKVTKNIVLTHILFYFILKEI